MSKMPRSFLIKKRDADLRDIPALEVGIQTGVCVHDHLKEEGTGKRDMSPGDSSEDENREPDERSSQDVDRGRFRTFKNRRLKIFWEYVIKY